jgi:hypothetical protein
MSHTFSKTMASWPADKAPDPAAEAQAERELADIERMISAGQWAQAERAHADWTRKYYPNPPFRDKAKMANKSSNIENRIQKAIREGKHR